MLPPVVEVLQLAALLLELPNHRVHGGGTDVEEPSHIHRSPDAPSEICRRAEGQSDNFSADHVGQLAPQGLLAHPPEGLRLPPLPPCLLLGLDVLPHHLQRHLLPLLLLHLLLVI